MILKSVMSPHERLEKCQKRCHVLFEWPLTYKTSKVMSILFHNSSSTLRRKKVKAETCFNLYCYQNSWNSRFSVWREFFGSAKIYFHKKVKWLKVDQILKRVYLPIFEHFFPLCCVWYVKTFVVQCPPLN